jgi:predicted DNA-binding ribbon-helix-helix protein
MMKSPVIKRSIAIKGRQTSVSLEDAFWHDLKLMAAAENKSLSALISSVNDCRQRGNLSSALRVFVLAQYQAMAVRAGQNLKVVKHCGQETSSSLALLWQIVDLVGFPNQFFDDSWAVGFWRADHGRQDFGLGRRA